MKNPPHEGACAHKIYLLLVLNIFTDKNFRPLEKRNFMHSLFTEKCSANLLQPSSTRYQRVKFKVRLGNGSADI